MHIEDLKFWHWILLGLLAGFAVGGAKLMGGPWFDTDNLTTLDNGTFEAEVSGRAMGYLSYSQLIQKYHGKQPLIKDLVIHPPLSGEPTGAYWVTGKTFGITLNHKDPKNPATPVLPYEQWDPFKFRAVVPYIARSGASGKYPTVVEFLAAVKKNPNPSLEYRYAWWEKPLPTMLLPTASGLLIIGIAWPLSLRLMQGLGMARPPSRARVKLTAGRAQAAKAPVDHSAGDLQLAQLNAQMDENLAGFASADSAAAPAAGVISPAKPKTLLNDEPVAAPKTQEELAREYGGEFYPVVKPVHKKE